MDVVYDLVVVLHLLGMAALVGGYLVAARGRAHPNEVMLWGARLQIVTGLVIVGLGEGAGVWGADQPDNSKIGAKLLIALVVVALTEIAAGKRRRSNASTLTHAAGLLAIVNVLVAVLVG